MLSQKVVWLSPLWSYGDDFVWIVLWDIIHAFDQVFTRGITWEVKEIVLMIYVVRSYP